MKNYSAIVDFIDIDTQDIYGTERYSVTAINKREARLQALKYSDDSRYFDERVSFVREVSLEEKP